MSSEIFSKKIFVQTLLNNERTKDPHYNILTQEKYKELMNEVIESKAAAKKTALQYRRIKRFDVIDTVEGLKLTARSEGPEVQYYLSVDEIYDVIKAAHLALGHGGRDRIRMETSKSYANVTTEMISLFLSLCDSCKVRKRKPLDATPFKSKTSLNRMHVMDVDCEKSSEIVAASAPDIISAKEIETKVTNEEESTADIQNAEVSQAAEVKPVVDVKTEVQNKVEEVRNHEPVTNGEVNGEVSGLSEIKFEVKGENCVENGEHEESEVQEVDRTGGENKEEAKERVAEVGEIKENGSGGCSEEEDRNSVTSSQSRKRTAVGEVEGEGSSSESDAGGKRVRMEREVEGENDGEDERERLVREYVDDCTESVDDMSRAADKLTREIGALGELLRAKELEWNSILRLRKLKEEMLERLLRKRRLAVIMTDNSANPEWQPNDKTRDRDREIRSSSSKPSGLMMVPIISSSPGNVTSTFTPRNIPSSSLRPPDTSGRLSRLQRPILPKPVLNQNAFIDQNSIVGEGRQGPILDVKSIIADYSRKANQDEMTAPRME